jgi:restriction system protein
MSIPDYQALMRPLLELLVDRREHALRDMRNTLAEKFQLTTEERERLLPSGGVTVFVDRVGWARYYLQRAGMLLQTRRSVYRISDAGLQLLAEVDGPIGTIDLRQRSPEFAAWTRGGRTEPELETECERQVEEQATPEEVLAAAHLNLRRAVESDVLARLRGCSPAFFEQVVVRLLVAMGYGGSLQDAGRAIGRSGDQGIDGIIKEDRLGLDAVYLQAKRWTNTVGRPDIQQFAGALAGHRARKGVFITTSTFSAEARSYVESVEPRGCPSSC